MASSANSSSRRSASAIALSLAVATASCHLGSANGSAAESAKDPPIYRIRYGMTVDEFAAVNKTKDVETPGLGMMITGPHVIMFEVEGQPQPFIIRNVGESENASTSIDIDYNFDNIGASTITGMYSILDGGDDDSNMTFAEAVRACEQVVSGFAGTGWKDRTWWLTKTYGPHAFWLDPSRVESGLPKVPEQESFPMRHFVNGPLLTECLVERNNYMAPDFGFENALGAYGNDPQAPMYRAKLAIMSRESIEPDWETEVAPE